MSIDKGDWRDAALSNGPAVHAVPSNSRSISPSLIMLQRREIVRGPGVTRWGRGGLAGCHQPPVGRSAEPDVYEERRVA